MKKYFIEQMKKYFTELMKKYFQILLLIGCPIITFTILRYLYGEEVDQTTIIWSYLAYIFVLKNINLKYYTFVDELKFYWAKESVKNVKILLPNSSYKNNVLTVKPEHLWGAKQIETLSKVKIYFTESTVFITSLRDQFNWILFFNGIILAVTSNLSSINMTEELTQTLNLDESIKRILCFLVVIGQMIFFCSQIILHRIRNNRLNSDLN